MGRSTFKSLIKQSSLSYDKMVAHVNLNHPRVVKKNEEDGTITFEKLPLGTPIGEMMSLMIDDKPQWVPFDQLGLGLTLYFKMIKIMIIILVVATLFSLPYMFVFNSGNEATDTSTGMDSILGSFSLGNIGQSKDLCASQDINSCDTIDLKCPDFSEITVLRQFGI